MCIIIIEGHDEGVVEYLKTGQKSGRTKGRDELDQRIILKGNIDLLEQIIKSNTANRKKYVNITISFLEDLVEVETLKKAISLYEELILSAYRRDEYYFYAEAHVPIVKSYVDENGTNRLRKPHIHIVVPNINLLTGASVNPWGLYKHHKKFFNAIQERICSETGTVSPSQRRRTSFEAKSSMLARKKGDAFQVSISDIKKHILEEILERDVLSTEDFCNLLCDIGEHKTLNKGKDNEYQAVKPTGAKKFINLRNFVFCKEFIQLTLKEKKLKLEVDEEADYSFTRPPQEEPEEVSALLEEWRNIRSRHIKYVKGNVPAHYRLMTRGEKVTFLDNLEAKYFQKLDSLHPRKRAAPLAVERAENGQGKQVRILNTNAAQAADSFLTQLIRDRADSAWASSHEVSAAVRNLNATIDVNFMLSDLVYSHGLVRSKYQTTGQEKLGEKPIAHNRIRCGPHNVNVSDFLTRQMHMRWPAAFAYMQHIHAKQKDHLPNPHPFCGRPDPALWAEFRKHRGETQKDLNREYDQYITALRGKAMEAKSAAELQRSYDRFTLFQIKMPAYVREILLALAEGQHDREKRHVAAALRTSHQKVRAIKLQLSSWSLYLCFLHKSAAASSVCLKELRKHAPARKTSGATLFITGHADAPLEDSDLVSELKLTRQVSEIGDVRYERKGVWLVKDEGATITVNPAGGIFAIEIASMLAQRKWDSNRFEGPPEHLQLAKAAAVLRGKRPPNTNPSRA